MDYQAENNKKSIMNKKEMIGEDQNTHTLFNSPTVFFFSFFLPQFDFLLKL